MGRLKGKQQHYWTNEEKEYLKEITPGHHHKEIIQLMNEKFEYQFTHTQITAAIKRYGLKTGFDGRFKKGSIPFNKGTKGMMKSNKTSFQKGIVPANKKPVGSERINVDGYTEIKVEEPNVYKLKQRVLYEQYHNVKLTSNQIIIFLNGDKSDFSKENLCLVDRKQLLVLNKEGLITDDIDTTKAGLNVANILIKINELNKK